MEGWLPRTTPGEVPRSALSCRRVQIEMRDGQLEIAERLDGNDSAQLQLQPIVNPYWKSRPVSTVGGSLS